MLDSEAPEINRALEERGKWDRLAAAWWPEMLSATDLHTAV
jgi:hypothetical protein